MLTGELSTASGALVEQASTRAFPTRFAEIDAGWLTECLRAAGALKHAVVSEFKLTPIGQGRGFAGQLARIVLHYDPGEPEAPRSVVIKVPAEREKTARTLGEIDGYGREVRFYRELAPSIGIATPRCYFAQHDGPSGRFCMLLEDLAPSKSPDLEVGLTLEQAELLLTELASFHARWWNRQAELPWLRPSEAMVRNVFAQFIDAWPRFQAQAHALYPTICKLSAITGELLRGDELLSAIYSSPQTLTHNDIHVDNVMLPSEQLGRFAVIDWQLLAWSRHGACDVARVLSVTMQPSLRREHGEHLLRHYLRELRACGVRGYSLGALKQRVREEYTSVMLVMVVAAVNLEASLTDPHFARMLERTEAALADARLVPRLRVMQAIVRCSRALARIFRGAAG